MVNINLTQVPDTPDEPSEYWISDLRLMVEDKEDIEGNHTITNKHISGIIISSQSSFMKCHLYKAVKIHEA